MIETIRDNHGKEDWLKKESRGDSYLYVLLLMKETAGDARANRDIDNMSARVAFGSMNGLIAERQRELGIDPVVVEY